MENLLKPNDTLANRISYYLVMLLLLSLPFNLFYSHLFLIGLALHTIIQIRKSNIKPVFTTTNFALTAVFFVTLLSIIYTNNKPQAFTELGRQVTILLIPLIFCFNQLDFKKYRHNFLLIFSLGCTITIFCLFLQAFFTIKYYHLPVTALVSSAFTNHNFSGPIDIHATFFSMQIAVALLYLLSIFMQEKVKAYKSLWLACCGVLAVGILQLSSKSVFVALLFAVNIALPLLILKGRTRFKFMAISASLFISAMALIYTKDVFRKRYVTDLKKDLSHSTDAELTDPRVARWSVAIGIGAQSPVIGHGAGTEVGLLKDPFFDHKFYRSYLAGLNAHNQFISFFIKSGIIGLAVYLFILVFGTRLAIAKCDFLLTSFMIIIAVVSFSENFLDVDKGIFFYAVFFSLLVFSAGSKAPDIQAKNIV
jgi:O-antigen ligase